MDYPAPRKGELLYFYSTREAAHDATLKAFRNSVFQLLTLIVAGQKENHEFFSTGAENIVLLPHPNDGI